ncbi:MAG: cupin domain-containing protein [bacterium]|nr:cupin domain-containing protein [bacterium]
MTQAYVRKAADVTPVPCPCGEATRIVTGADNDRVSIHRVRIEGEAKKHYHKVLHEHYIVLEGSGEVELGDERVPVEAGDVIAIPPGTPHALRGHFEIINVVTPPFDSEDEYVVEE